MKTHLTSFLRMCASTSRHIVAVCITAYAMPLMAMDGHSHQPTVNAATKYDAALFMQYNLPVVLTVLGASVVMLVILAVMARVKEANLLEGKE